MMPVPSKPQKTDGFHLRTDKDPAVTCFSHISRTVVMKPKIRLITSGSVPVSAYLYTYFLFFTRSLQPRLFFFFLPLPSVWKMRVMCHVPLMHSATLQANGKLISGVDAEKRNYPGGE
jgi:hypothetical protein